MGLEIIESGVGRAYAEVIKDSSFHSLEPFFEKYISKQATIKTDEWTGYSPLKKQYKKLTQLLSDSGKNFPDLHIHIMNLKGWLRGIHHHCSKEHMQGYLNEYHFRYNRRNNLNEIFNTIVKRMVENKPVRLAEINYKAT